jgi:hypothetical protein
MKRNWFIIGLVLVLVVCLCGCTININTSPEAGGDKIGNIEIGIPENTDDKTIVDKVEDALFGSYEDILAEYTKKLREATPILIAEYNAEARTNDAGLTGLATICNEKVSKLAEISNDGVQEMAKLYYKKGSGSYEEYSDWAQKIYDVYMEEAGKIQEAYMNSAM